VGCQRIVEKILYCRSDRLDTGRLSMRSVRDGSDKQRPYRLLASRLGLAPAASGQSSSSASYETEAALAWASRPTTAANVAPAYAETILMPVTTSTSRKAVTVAAVPRPSTPPDSDTLQRPSTPP
jgi:hypothetical protein